MCVKQRAGEHQETKRKSSGRVRGWKWAQMVAFTIHERSLFFSFLLQPSFLLLFLRAHMGGSCARMFSSSCPYNVTLHRFSSFFAIFYGFTWAEWKLCNDSLYFHNQISINRQLSVLTKLYYRSSSEGLHRSRSIFEPIKSRKSNNDNSPRELNCNSLIRWISFPWDFTPYYWYFIFSC